MSIIEQRTRQIQDNGNFVIEFFDFPFGCVQHFMP